MKNQSEYSPEQDEIIKLLEKHGPLRANEIAKRLKKEHATVRWHLAQMASDGIIERLSRGLYGVVGTKQQITHRSHEAKAIEQPTHPLERSLEILNNFAKENPALVASGGMAIGAAAPRWVPIFTGVGVAFSVGKHYGSSARSTHSTTVLVGISGLAGLLTFLLMDYTLRDDDSLLAVVFPRLRNQAVEQQPLLAPSGNESSMYQVMLPLSTEPVPLLNLAS